MVTGVAPPRCPKSTCAIATGHERGNPVSAVLAAVMTVHLTPGVSRGQPILLPKVPFQSRSRERQGGCPAQGALPLRLGLRAPKGAGGRHCLALSSGGGQGMRKSDGTIGLGPGQTLPTEGHPSVCLHLCEMGTLMAGCKERTEEGGRRRCSGAPPRPCHVGTHQERTGGWELSGGSSRASSHQRSHLLPQLLK